MSSKMNQIPFLSSYEDVRAEMNRDLQYRLNSRTARTSLGRPLYYRINVQMITTQECPFYCPFAWSGRTRCLAIMTLTHKSKR